MPTTPKGSTTKGCSTAKVWADLGKHWSSLPVALIPKLMIGTQAMVARRGAARRPVPVARVRPRTLPAGPFGGRGMRAEASWSRYSAVVEFVQLPLRQRYGLDRKIRRCCTQPLQLLVICVESIEVGPLCCRARGTRNAEDAPIDWTARWLFHFAIAPEVLEHQRQTLLGVSDSEPRRVAINDSCLKVTDVVLVHKRSQRHEVGLKLRLSRERRTVCCVRAGKSLELLRPATTNVVALGLPRSRSVEVTPTRGCSHRIAKTLVQPSRLHRREVEHPEKGRFLVLQPCRRQRHPVSIQVWFAWYLGVRSTKLTCPTSAIDRSGTSSASRGLRAGAYTDQMWTKRRIGL